MFDTFSQTTRFHKFAIWFMSILSIPVHSQLNSKLAFVTPIQYLTDGRTFADHR